MNNLATIAAAAEIRDSLLSDFGPVDHETDVVDTMFEKAGATFDKTRQYRYMLWRTWDEDLPICTFVMLNPSTADAFKLDPTVRRCIGFARREGCGSLRVANIFALRSTDPGELYRRPDVATDARNNAVILMACEDAKVIVAAWGNHGAYMGRGQAVLDLLKGFEVKCLGMTKEGHPRHPLYVAADTKLIPLGR